MLLIDYGKLDYIKVSSTGLFKIGEIGAPEEYKAVKSPIKVKFDKDILVLFYAEIDENGVKSITYSPLYSTRRKFKDEYVKELVMSKIDYVAEKALLRFRHS
jgi:hypothetical protein